MGMDVGERYMNHAGAYRTSSSQTDSTEQNSDHDLGAIRDLLEDSLDASLVDIALGLGPTYPEAHQDALDSLPEDTRIGDIHTAASAEHGGYTAVALQYRAEDSQDWIDEQLARFQDDRQA